MTQLTTIDGIIQAQARCTSIADILELGSLIAEANEGNRPGNASFIASLAEDCIAVLPDGHVVAWGLEGADQYGTARSLDVYTAEGRLYLVILHAVELLERIAKARAAEDATADAEWDGPFDFTHGGRCARPRPPGTRAPAVPRHPAGGLTRI